MRAGGILLPISSLPGKYGIGTFGREAYQFIDFLHECNQKYWQILPLGPTTFGDSPYQTYSTFAGSEFYLDLEDLYNDSLITKKDLEKEELPLDSVDYDTLKVTRIKLYKKALKKFKNNIPNDYIKFIEENNDWVKSYAYFRTFKDHFDGVSFNNWPKEIINKQFDNDSVKELIKKLQDDIDLHLFIQYYFFKHWYKLKDYANKLGIKFIGDLPIYVSYDSSDVWSNPSEFLLDENLVPKAIAGCPPDAFSETGQLWGNPLYRYDEMKKNNYSWWMKRIKHSLKMYDVLRIDHFRGFEAYFSIPYGDTTAINGHWEKGPDFQLFEELFKNIKNPDMIMEDLGYLTNDVYKLLKKTGFPGMRVLSFAFDDRLDNAYLPHNYIENTICYTGTHDNVPLEGLVKELSNKQIEQIFNYFNISKRSDIRITLIKAALNSVAKLAVIPLQDYLGLDESSRINTPNTVGINWKWRFSFDLITDKIIKEIKELTKKAYR